MNNEEKQAATRKALSLLGLARKAGKLSMGNDAAIEAMRQGDARIVLFANDISERTARGVRNAAEELFTPCLIMGASMDEISMALGKRTGVIAINDDGFAKKLHSLCTDE